MKIRKILPLLLILALLGVLWLTSSAQAHPPDDDPVIRDAGSVDSVVSPLLQYQARLTDPATGEIVADGVYTMTFSIYDVDVGGTTLWTETKGVEVRGGVFSTALGDASPLDLSLFQGQALWLGVAVGTDGEATPRQQILPVAYALSLVPGAVISTTDSSPTLQVNNSGSGQALHVEGDVGVYGGLAVLASKSHGISARTSSTATGAAGVEGKNTGDGYGVFGYAEGEGPGVYGANVGSGPGGRFYSSSGHALQAFGSAEVTGDLTVGGQLTAPRTRYIPITAGDLMYDENNVVNTGDCCNGILFPDGAQSGGSMVFPLPNDYEYGAEFHLDLYLIPLDSGAGSFDFYVRWVGLKEGDWSGTGASVTSQAVPLGTVNYIHKQSFTLPEFSVSSPPEMIELTIRRMADDTYGGNVTLIGLKLSYQAVR